MSTSRILRIKQFLSVMDSDEVKKLSDNILKEDDNVIIKNLLNNYYKEINKRINTKKNE